MALQWICSECCEIIFTINFTGLERTVQLMIDSGAEVNSVNKFNNSALMLAAQAGHAKTVELLIERGANVNILANNGDTALIAATSNGKVKLTRIFK